MFTETNTAEIEISHKAVFTSALRTTAHYSTLVLWSTRRAYFN